VLIYRKRGEEKERGVRNWEKFKIKLIWKGMDYREMNRQTDRPRQTEGERGRTVGNLKYRKMNQKNFERRKRND
jgi:hypothetical protein